MPELKPRITDLKALSAELGDIYERIDPPSEYSEEFMAGTIIGLLQKAIGDGDLRRLFLGPIRRWIRTKAQEEGLIPLPERKTLSEISRENGGLVSLLDILEITRDLDIDSFLGFLQSSITHEETEHA